MRLAARLRERVERRRLSGTGALLVVAVVAGLPAGAAELTALRAPERIVPREYFGLHMHRADAGTPWPSVAFGAWRLLDAYVNWPNLQPARDRWDFSRLDRYVELAEAANVELLLPLAFSPAWASARPDEKGPYGLGTAAEPASLDDWRNYVRTVAARYRGRIRHFELWNEVNVRQFFTGSFERLAELERETARALKDVDPGNILVSPSFVGEGRHREFDAYLTQGGGRAADVIGWHFYLVNYPPEQIPAKLVRPVRELLARHGLAGKPLWNTEIGYRIENGDGTAESFHVDKSWRMRRSEEAAALIARSLAINWVSGIERVYWYAWDNQNLGLIEPTSKLPKAAAKAYGATARWLIGARVTECVRDADGLWRCALRRDPGRTAYLLWREEGVSQYALPAEWRIQETEALLGGSTAVATQAPLISVGPLPVLAKCDRLPWRSP